MASVSGPAKVSTGMGWVGKHVRSPLSISAPAAALGWLGTGCSARASCKPKWPTEPVVRCWLARRRLPTGQAASVRQAWIGARLAAAGLDIGGRGSWPAEAAARGLFSEDGT